MIEIKNESRATCTLEELEYGEVFLFENRLYILDCNGNTVQIGDEESGEVGGIHRTDVVLPVDIEITIK